MAARKSCTHLTWAEAKAKVGEGGSSKNKSSNVSKKMTLEQKVIAKSLQVDDLRSQKKKEYKQIQKYKAKEEQLALRRQKEREQKRQDEQVKPWEQSKAKMSHVAMSLQQKEPTANNTTTFDKNDETLKRKIVHCKQMQVDELVSLEAMYDGTDELLILEATEWTRLQELVETWQEDEENESILRKIVDASPISFVLQLTLVDELRNGHLEAHVLIQVTFPPFYLADGEETNNDDDNQNKNNRLPQFDIPFFMVTDKSMVCSADKPLETLAHLDETGLRKALQEKALEMIPDPCIYLVAVTWVSESLWDYVEFKR